MRLNPVDRDTFNGDPRAIARGLNQDSPAVSLVTRLILLVSLMLCATASHAVEEESRLSVIKVVALRQSSIVYGSGIVVAPGKLITNCHVVGNASEIKLISQGRISYGRLIVHDAERDLCVVAAPDLDIPTVRFGSTQELVLGQPVFAAGYPGGEQFNFSAGRVKGLHEASGSRVIQTSAHFEPGSSGGGLFDAQDRLLGILTFKAASGGDFHFVLPIEWVLKLIDADAAATSSIASGHAFWNKALREQPFFLQAAALEEKKDWHGLLKLAKISAVKDVQCGSEPWIAMSKAYAGLGRPEHAPNSLCNAPER
jgi:serine protease Do